MTDLAGPQTFWLNVTNVAMGVIALAAVLILTTSIVRETLRRVRKQR